MSNAECVATHPRDYSSCVLQTEDNFGFLVAAYIFYSFIPGAYVSIIYLTHRSVWMWWKSLLCGEVDSPVKLREEKEDARDGSREKRKSIYKGDNVKV